MNRRWGAAGTALGKPREQQQTRIRLRKINFREGSLSPLRPTFGAKVVVELLECFA